MKEKAPEFGIYGPIWWHHHGSKMRVKTKGIQNDFLVIQGSAAEVVISRAADANDGWYVVWKINYTSDTGVSGRTWFSSDNLAQAFGLWNGISHCGSEWMIRRYGGTIAEQGRYIRYKKWLNIPGPGTGHDGDPNVSIELTEEIRKAIKELIRT